MHERKLLAGKRRSSVITLLVAVVIVGVAAVTVVSRQLAKHNENSAAPSGAKRYVTVKVAGREVQVNQQTVQVKPLTPEEAQRTADELKTRLNKSTDGLVEEKHADGSVSVDLKGRFQNVILVRTNSDGTVERACVDEPQAAAEFLGLDPKTLGANVAASPSTKPVRSPIRKINQ